MYDEENSVRERLRVWKLDPADDAMLDRIVKKSVTRPQMLPLGYKLQQWLTQCFSEWHSGFSYKLASLALCAVVGFSSGLTSSDQAVDITTIAFGSVHEGDDL